MQKSSQEQDSFLNIELAYPRGHRLHLSYRISCRSPRFRQGCSGNTRGTDAPLASSSLKSRGARAEHGRRNSEIGVICAEATNGNFGVKRVPEKFVRFVRKKPAVELALSREILMTCMMSRSAVELLYSLFDDLLKSCGEKLPEMERYRRVSLDHVRALEQAIKYRLYRLLSFFDYNLMVLSRGKRTCATETFASFVRRMPPPPASASLSPQVQRRSAIRPCLLATPFSNFRAIAA